jgi:hypothetical protein
MKNFIKKILKKIIKKEETRISLKKFYHKIFKIPVEVKKPEDIKTISEEENISNVTLCLQKNFRYLQPIGCYFTENRIKRINLVTTGIDKEYLFGGVATCLIIATEFSNRFNLPLRIITRDRIANSIDYNNILELHKIKKPSQVSFYSDYDRDVIGSKDLKIDISKNDIFIATSWWTAFAIKKTFSPLYFFYIIQEVETFFYQHGDDHYLCSTIMNDKNINYIVNSSYLFEYFKNHEPNIYKRGTVFEPAFPMFHLKKLEKKNKYKLFFYARPNNPRNLFFYGLRILDMSIELGLLNTNEWDIYFLGYDMPDLYFSNKSKAINLGVLDWQQYKDFLSDVDLALSLMYTPHPSYPPFDVAASGGVVISNKCFNKTKFHYSKNVILSDLQEDIFLQNMKKAIELAKNIEKRKENYYCSTIPRSWQVNLNPIMDHIGDIIQC